MPLTESQLSKPQFLYLSTQGWKTGKQHRVEIWFVEHNERYYIVSERREGAHWVQNIKHNPKVSFSINDNLFKSAARVVDQEKESDLAEEVSKLEAKRITAIATVSPVVITVITGDTNKDEDIPITPRRRDRSQSKIRLWINYSVKKQDKVMD
jgi:deazaflavin-dependent oxidoreductase (nitroreductase family)